MSTVTFGPNGYYEESRQSEKRGSGGWGQRVFVSKYEDRHADWAPKVSQSKFTDGLGLAPCWEDGLVATSIKYEFTGARQPELEPLNTDFSYCRQIVEYSTVLAITGWSVQSRGKPEFIEVGISRQWSDGTFSDQPLTIPFYTEEIVASKLFIFDATQLVNLRCASNKVNSSQFTAPWGETFAPRTLLLKTFDREMVDNDSYGLMNHITLHFLASGERTFDYFWRLPPLQRNADGSPYYDENYRPVYNGTPGWDTYLQPVFEGYDFNLIV
jgi:hypothetical protein